MAKEESHRLTPTQLADRVWAIAENIRFCLYTSVKGGKLQQWPLTATAERDERAFYFLVSQKGGKYSNLRRAPEVVLGFADPGGPKYVVINGTARLSNDRGKIKELWTPFAKAWWNSENDPDIRLLTVTPLEAELWDSPNRLIASAILLTAAVAGRKPALGDHGAVRL